MPLRRKIARHFFPASLRRLADPARIPAGGALYRRREPPPYAAVAGDSPGTEKGDLNMRITIGLAAMASLCLLAGCNRGAANNSANAPAPAPAANEAGAPAPEPPAPANESAAAAPTGEVAECVRDAPGNLPEGTDANAFCTCAVGKMTSANLPQREAINQCATEMNITLPSRGE